MSQADIGCENGDQVWWYQDQSYFTGTVVDNNLDFDGRIQVQMDSGKVKTRLFPCELHMGCCPYLTK